ncbi:MAG: DUF4245 family protein [Microbacteriaceae bacterium]
MAKAPAAGTAAARVAAPRVVAELGRPETPEETAARTAAASARYRDSKTLRNLVAALIGTVAIVVALVAIVVRPDPQLDLDVDWHQVAAEAATPVVDPQLPEGWVANAAEMRGSGDSDYWYIGFVTPEGDFAAVEQHDSPDDDLVADLLPKGSTGPVTQTAGGVSWSAYTAADAADAGNYARLWEAQGTASQIVIYGTADAEEFATFARAVGQAIP